MADNTFKVPLVIQSSTDYGDITKAKCVTKASKVISGVMSPNKRKIKLSAAKSGHLYLSTPGNKGVSGIPAEVICPAESQMPFVSPH